MGCAQRVGEFRLLSGEDRLQLRIFLDRSVVEVYANGRVALTAGGDCLGLGEGAPRREGEGALTLFSRDGQARASVLDLWEMASIWDARTA